MSDFFKVSNPEWGNSFNDYLYLSGLNDLHEAFIYIKNYEEFDREIKMKLFAATLREVGSGKTINSHNIAMPEDVPLLGREFSKLYQDWCRYLGYLVDPNSNGLTELPNTRVLVDLAQSELTIAKFFNKKYIHHLDEASELVWPILNGDSLSPFEDIEHGCEIWRTNATDSQLLLEHLHTKDRLDSIIKSNQGLGPSPIYTSPELLPNALIVALGIAKLANANAMLAKGDIKAMTESLYEVSQAQRIVTKSLARKLTDDDMSKKFSQLGSSGVAKRNEKYEKLKAHVFELAAKYPELSGRKIALAIEKEVLDTMAKFNVRLTADNAHNTIYKYVREYKNMTRSS